jgi:hypothetical protein
MATFTQTDDLSAQVPNPRPNQKTLWFDAALNQWRYRDDSGAEFPLGGASGQFTPALEVPKGITLGPADVGKLAGLTASGEAEVYQWQSIPLRAYLQRSFQLHTWQGPVGINQASVPDYVLNGVPSVLPLPGDTLELYAASYAPLAPPITFVKTVLDPSREVMIAPSVDKQVAFLEVFFASPGHIWAPYVSFSNPSAAGDYITFTLSFLPGNPTTAGVLGNNWLLKFNSNSGLPGVSLFQGGTDYVPGTELELADAITSTSFLLRAGSDFPPTGDLAADLHLILNLIEGATDLRRDPSQEGNSNYTRLRHNTPGLIGNSSLLRYRYNPTPDGNSGFMFTEEVIPFDWGSDGTFLPVLPCLGVIAAISGSSAWLDNGTLLRKPSSTDVAALEALPESEFTALPAWAMEGGTEVGCPLELFVFLSNYPDPQLSRKVFKAILGTFVNAPAAGQLALVHRTSSLFLD